ncbi:MAG TPA: hypothetical protein VHV57_18650 [Acidimicrobiales bacterium]|jgi:hypothetical protein|nr:hypothetical protein [Acidimicrobiales bacterium]
MKSEALVAIASPLAAEVGPAFYFDGATVARGAELGLDVFQFYALGRGGVLGNVETPVIVSAFGYFNAATVDQLWNTARAIVEPRVAARAFMECGHEFGRTHFGDVANLKEYCAAAETVTAAVHPAGLALFAGLAGEPLPTDLPARAMHLAALLREFRGSAHLVAIVANEIEPKVAHYIRRPEMMGVFGYSPEEVPAVTDAERTRLVQADAMTDRLVAGPYGVLNDEQADALVAGLQAMKAALAS